MGNVQKSPPKLLTAPSWRKHRNDIEYYPMLNCEKLPESRKSYCNIGATKITPLPNDRQNKLRFLCDRSAP